MIRVLTIGPDDNLKGGIASVLKSYRENQKDFELLPTISKETKTGKAFTFGVGILKLIGALATNRDIEIIHIHGASRGSFYRKYLVFLLVKYIFRRKVIYHIHGAEYHLFYGESNRPMRTLIRHMIAASDAVIVLSQQWKEFFEKNFTPQKIFVLNNIVEYPKPARVLEKSDKLSFLFLGRIGERKGIFDLLNTIKTHKEELKGKILLRIGGDGEIERLQNFIKYNALEDLIQYDGWIGGQKKIEILNESDVYILPSYNEGLPISILEAMSYKMPVITTSVGGIPEVVKDHKNGLLVEPGDQEGIYNAIKFFMNNKDTLTAFGEKSYEIVSDYFPGRVLSHLDQIYREVANDK